MLPGISISRVTEFRWYFIISMLLIWSYLGIYGVWASNNLAVNLDNQNDDRYISLEFWRLAKIGADIITPFLTLMLLYNSTSKWFTRFHCLIIVIAIALEATCIGWFIVDLVDCSNVAHCDGDGNGPLGYDVAFWVVFWSTVGRMIINIIFLFLNYRINRLVQIQRYQLYFADPFRPGIQASANINRYNGNVIPDQFVGNSMDNNENDNKISPNDKLRLRNDANIVEML